METAAGTDRQTRFAQVAHQVGDPVRRYVARRAPADTVDDLVADVFLVLWRRLDDVPADDPLPWRTPWRGVAWPTPSVVGDAS